MFFRLEGGGAKLLCYNDSDSIDFFFEFSEFARKKNEKIIIMRFCHKLAQRN